MSVRPAWSIFEVKEAEHARQVFCACLARDPMVVVYHKQGIMPQLFKLISSTGGYISCLTLMFLSCFVRKYPKSAVVQIYEARTLVLERIWSRQRPKDDSKPKEKPVALPLPPGLFTQLGLDTE